MTSNADKYNNPEELDKMTIAVEQALEDGVAKQLLNALQGTTLSSSVMNKQSNQQIKPR